MLFLAIATSFLGRVPLWTAPDDGMVGCYTSGTSGVLTTDSAYGTAIIEREARVPIMWPHGYTAATFRHGSRGRRHVRAGGGTDRDTGADRGGYTGDTPRAFLACGLVQAE